jgi:uncharacterized protein (TIGR02466 family)
MNEEKIIWPLFSSPVFKSHIDVSDIDLSTIKWAKNYNNWISESQNVLNDPTYVKLAERSYDVLCEYFYGVMRATEDVQIGITESWFNKTEQGQSHHRHWHPNSVFSGIVYLGGDVNSGYTKFISSVYDTIEFNIQDANLYNSRSWSIAPKVGDVVIFPSRVEHLVDEYTGTEPRITLSFNSFLSGTINKDPLTRLSL